MLFILSSAFWVSLCGKQSRKHSKLETAVSVSSAGVVGAITPKIRKLNIL